MALIWYYLGLYCIWVILVSIFMLIRDIVSVRWTHLTWWVKQGIHVNGPNFQNSFNMAFSQMVLQISHFCQHLHAHYGHNHFQMSSLTRWVNKDFKLIKQTCRIPVTWDHLREYHIWTILANIFMLIKDIISPRWACWHVNSIGISFWLIKFPG